MRALLLYIAAVLLLMLASCGPPTVAEIEHFPLRGAHTEVTCSGCHGDSLADATPTTCGGCHEEDRPQDHYEGDCVDCHNELSWEGGIADHSFFPLEFGHGGLFCLDCHEDGTFEGLDSTCASCHERPQNHFAGACEGCHTIRDWDDAEFDHDDFFPTPHEGVSACNDCHPTATDGDYSTFSCTDCHEHRQSEMDDEHLGEVSGYVYDSNACLDCHPNGEEDD